MRIPYVTSAITATVIALSMSGCQQQKASGLPTHFDSIVVNVPQKLVENDSLSPQCNFQINLKYATPDDSINQVINKAIVYAAFEYENLTPQAAVDSFKNSYLKHYKEDIMPFYQEDVKKGEVSAWYNYEYTLNSKQTVALDSIWGYQLELISYEGGAHGSHTISYMNFSKATGKQLQLEDVFVENYKEPLTVILLDALKDHLQVESIDELHEEGYLNWTDMYPSKNFLLSPDGIKFYYNAYEIAPYAAGPTEITIPYESLKDILK